MKSDPIVEETRKLRDGYAAKHGYDVRRIAEDLRQWEKLGFPMPANAGTALRHPLPSASAPKKRRRSA